MAKRYLLAYVTPCCRRKVATPRAALYDRLTFLRTCPKCRQRYIVGKLGRRWQQVAHEKLWCNGKPHGTGVEIYTDGTEFDDWSARAPITDVLSVRQPWAWAIVKGHKRIENRAWPTKHRGPLLIHAAKTYSDRSLARFADLGFELAPGLIQGAIIGSVTLTDCVRPCVARQNPELAPWVEDDDDAWAFLLENAVEFSHPILCGGYMGIWHIDRAR